MLKSAKFMEHQSRKVLFLLLIGLSILLCNELWRLSFEATMQTSYNSPFLTKD